MIFLQNLMKVVGLRIILLTVNIDELQVDYISENIRYGRKDKEIYTNQVN